VIEPGTTCIQPEQSGSPLPPQRLLSQQLRWGTPGYSRHHRPTGCVIVVRELWCFKFCGVDHSGIRARRYVRLARVPIQRHQVVGRNCVNTGGHKFVVGDPVKGVFENKGTAEVKSHQRCVKSPDVPFLISFGLHWVWQPAFPYRRYQSTASTVIRYIICS